MEQLDTGTAAALAIVCLIALVLILFSGGDDGDGTT